MSRYDGLEYSIEFHPDGKGVTLAGILRLVSPAAYKKVLTPIYDKMATVPDFLLDIADIEYMNSSGITALSRIVMLARERDMELTAVVNERVPWQRKTLASLQRLYPKFVLRPRPG